MELEATSTTVVHADNILVLEHGSVVEQGKHIDLLGQEGRYAKLWTAQTRDLSKAPLVNA